MSDHPPSAPPTPSQRLVASLIRFFATDLVVWLDEDPRRVELANSLLELLRKPVLVERLKIRPTDLLLTDHLTADALAKLAKAREEGTETPSDHLESCSLCDGIVEAQAAHRIITKALRTDRSGLNAKTSASPTDNDQWFGNR